MWLIRKKTMEMIMEASKDSYPNEFGAMLRAEGNIIYEIAILPGTVNGNVHVIFPMYSIPIDFHMLDLCIHIHPEIQGRLMLICICSQIPGRFILLLDIHMI